MPPRFLKNVYNLCCCSKGTDQESAAAKNRKSEPGRPRSLSALQKRVGPRQGRTTDSKRAHAYVGEFLQLHGAAPKTNFDAVTIEKGDGGDETCMVCDEPLVRGNRRRCAQLQTCTHRIHLGQCTRIFFNLIGACPRCAAATPRKLAALRRDHEARTAAVSNFLDKMKAVVTLPNPET